MAINDSQLKLLSIVASTATKDKQHTATVCGGSYKNLFLTSKGISRFLVTYLQHQIREIEKNCDGAGVKISIGKDGLDFTISSDNDQALYRAYELLKELVSSVVTREFEIKQPGMRMIFGEEGNGKQLVKSIEKDYSCVIEMEFEKLLAGDEEIENKDEPSEVGRKMVVKDKKGAKRNTPAKKNQRGSSNDSVVTTPEGIRITLKVGNIATEKVCLYGIS